MRRNISAGRLIGRRYSSFWSGVMGVVMIVISIFIYSGAISEYVYAKNVRENGEAVYASCTYKWSETKTTRTRTGSKYNKKTKTTKHTYYYADASYNYNDQMYTCHKLSVTSATQVGDAIKIYVLPEHPEKYIQDGKETSTLVKLLTFSYLPIIGIVCLAMPISNLRKKRRYGITSNTVNQNVNNSYNYNNNFNNPNNAYRGYDNYNPNNIYQGYDSNNSNNDHW